MLNKNTHIVSAISVCARNCLNSSYLRAVGKASLDWRFHRQPAIQKVSISDLAISPQQLQLHVENSDVGDTPIIDMVAICSLVQSVQPHLAFEFGTFTGSTALHIVLNAPSLKELVTVDLPPEARGSKIPGLEWDSTIDDRVIGKRFRDTVHTEKIRQIFADSRTLDVACYVQQIDFVWVDACHEYEFVASDSAKALQMVAPNGIVS